MARLVTASGGRRHAVSGRKAPRHDAGWRSVWRRAAPTTQFDRFPRQRGDRTALECLDLGVRASAMVCPSRAPWNKWRGPAQRGGNRLCRERPLIGLQPRRERFRDGVGGNPLSPQSHADYAASRSGVALLGFDPLQLLSSMRAEARYVVAAVSPAGAAVATFG